MTVQNRTGGRRFRGRSHAGFGSAARRRARPRRAPRVRRRVVGHTRPAGPAARSGCSPGGRPVPRRRAWTRWRRCSRRSTRTTVRQPRRGRRRRQSNAKAKLAADLQNGKPPDSFQGHAGAELHDYIDADQIEPVNDRLSRRLGGDEVFPKNLLDRLTVDGKHLLGAVATSTGPTWCGPTPAVLQEGRHRPRSPTDIDAWIADMDKVKASGVATPLSVGGTWTQVQLFENVLIADLGADRYSGLFDGRRRGTRPRSRRPSRTTRSC